MRSVKLTLLLAVLILGTDYALAQDRPASPRGQAYAQVGGEYEGRSYEGGGWIEVDYGRPLLRGRTDMFGSGESYGQKLYAGAPVWRAGANQSTRFMTEVPLSFGGETLPAGEYSMFVELNSPSSWTLIFSSYEAKNSGREESDGLWGSYGYTDDKDVLRTTMMVQQAEMSLDQFTIFFMNVDGDSGTLTMMWDKSMAMAPFTVAN